MEAGKLRHSITIQSPVQSPRDSFGKITTTYSDFYTCHASIQQYTPDEVERAQQLVSEATHIIKIRWFDGIKPTFRIMYGLRIFNILQMKNIDERNIEIEFRVKEVVA